MKINITYEKIARKGLIDFELNKDLVENLITDYIDRHKSGLVVSGHFGFDKEFLTDNLLSATYYFKGHITRKDDPQIDVLITGIGKRLAVSENKNYKLYKLEEKNNAPTIREHYKKDK